MWFKMIKRSNLGALSAAICLLVSISSVRADDVRLDATSVTTLGGGCTDLNRLMSVQGGACRCYDNRNFVQHDDRFLTDLTTTGEADGDMISLAGADDQTSEQGVWIGCSRERMPAIFKALETVPSETNLSKLWIWDSLIPLVPNQFFGKVRPRRLVIDSCHLGEFTGNGAFAPMAEQLTELELKNNIIRNIDSDLLAPLRQLRLLDLSGNNLTNVGVNSFGSALPQLRVLSLNRNRLTNVADRAFVNMSQIRYLNLADNQLTNITADTFAGLTRLESLNLENNRIEEIDERAFEKMTKLRILNLGGNRLTKLRLPAAVAQSLEKLMLHNNSFAGVDALTADSDGLKLKSLYLDNNRLQQLPSSFLKRWPNLQQLSLTFNQLTCLAADAFGRMSLLRTLSLQNNQLSQTNTDALKLLPSLRHLFLSQNQLTALSADAFNGVSIELRTLSLAQNKLESIDERAFSTVPKLQKLQLHGNNLKTLSRGVFYGLSELVTIDLSDNLWVCDCEILWLANWIKEREETIVANEKGTSCAEQQPAELQRQMADLNLAARPLTNALPDLQAYCRGGRQLSSSINDQMTIYGNSVWITVLGIVLGVVSILILLAVLYLYFQDASRNATNGVSSGPFGRWAPSGVMLRGEHVLRRVPSDMVNLIDKCSTTTSNSLPEKL